MSEVRDTDYGNYSSFEDNYHWADNFFPRREASKKAEDKFKEGMTDLLDDIADDLGLDTKDWERKDYDQFREIMQLY